MIRYKFNLQDKAYFDDVSDLLFELEALSIEVIDGQDEPIFATNEESHPLWSDMQMSVLFNEDSFDKNTICNALNNIIGSNITDSIEVVQNKDWQEQWLLDTKPICIDNNLTICPTHLKDEHYQNNAVILDPGLAFGTGSHPTTRMCLEWIAKNNMQNQDILDLGCGSGILGIAAKKLGAKKVLFIDNDKQALDATKSNCLKNSIDLENVDIKLPEENPASRFDIIFANIYLNVLIDLKESINSYLNKNGQILLTGILTEQVDKLLLHYSDFDISEQKLSGQWVLLVAKKRIIC